MAPEVVPTFLVWVPGTFILAPYLYIMLLFFSKGKHIYLRCLSVLTVINGMSPLFTA